MSYRASKKTKTSSVPSVPEGHCPRCQSAFCKNPNCRRTTPWNMGMFPKSVTLAEGQEWELIETLHKDLEAVRVKIKEAEMSLMMACVKNPAVEHPAHALNRFQIIKDVPPEVMRPFLKKLRIPDQPESGLGGCPE